MSSPTAYKTLASAVLRRKKNPSIFPFPRVETGNNVSFSENKTKRTWLPNIRAIRWPVTILGGESGRQKARMPQMRVITQVSKLRDFEKAGGVEGLLVSTRPENLSYFGKKMRSALFGELHRMKDRTKKKRREEVRAEGEEARKITAQNAPRIPADRVEPQKLLT